MSIEQKNSTLQNESRLRLLYQHQPADVVMDIVAVYSEVCG